MGNSRKIKLTDDALVFLFVFADLIAKDFKTEGVPTILLSPVFQLMELMSEPVVVKLRKEVSKLDRKVVDKIWTPKELANAFLYHGLPLDFLEGKLEASVMDSLKALRGRHIIKKKFFINENLRSYLFMYIFFGLEGMTHVVWAMKKVYVNQIEIKFYEGRPCLVFNEKVSKATLQNWVDRNFKKIEAVMEKEKLFGSQKTALFRDLKVFVEKKVRNKKNLSIASELNRDYGFNLNEDSIKKILKRFKRDIFSKYFVP